MIIPMPPELLEQLGLEPCADTDPAWPEDHDALGWGRRVAKTAELNESDGLNHDDRVEVERDR
jgi:hypothetical protein